MGFVGNETAWELLGEIAKKPQTPTQLAKKIKTSLPHTVNTIRLLKAYRLIEEQTQEREKPGRPPKTLELVRSACSIKVASKGLVFSEDFTPNPTQALLAALSTFSPNTGQALARFLFKRTEILEKCTRIGMVKEEKNKIELFLETKHVDTIRAKYSSGLIPTLEGKVKIACWTHSPKETKEGLNKGDEHFTLMEESKTIYAR